MNLHAASQRTDPGLLLVQVDGLSYRHLQEGLQKGRMPHLAERLRDGDLQESPYRCGLPTHTGVVQAGILYGESVLPSNQWLEKKTGQIMNVLGTDTSDLVEDQFLKSGAHGLIEGGSAYLTPLDGHAKRACFTINDLARTRRDHGKFAEDREVAGDFARLGLRLALHPLQAVATAARTGFEFVRGVHERKRTDIPQSFLKDRVKPAAWSAIQNVFLTDASTRAMAARMKHGDPAIFADLPGCDDQSHALGPERGQHVLKSIDHDLDILIKQAEHGKRPYHVVIFADHGQSEVVSFQEKYGESLFDFVQRLLPGAPPPKPEMNQGWPDDPRFRMIDFGTGAHLYFKYSTDPLDGRDVEAHYPGLQAKLLAHPGIAMVVTRDGQATDIQGKRGSVHVDAGGAQHVTGQNPLTRFGDASILARQIHDQAHRHGAGDVMVFGDFVGDKIVNFALHPQLGTHGTMGNGMDLPFLIQTAGLGINTSHVTEASQIHDQLAKLLPSDSPARPVTP